jgi:hypothetical protein
MKKRNIGKNPIVPLPVVDPAALELPEIAGDLGSDPPDTIRICGIERKIN